MTNKLHRHLLHHTDGRLGFFFSSDDVRVIELQQPMEADIAVLELESEIEIFEETADIDTIELVSDIITDAIVGEIEALDAEGDIGGDCCDD